MSWTNVLNSMKFGNGSTPNANDFQKKQADMASGGGYLGWSGRRDQDLQGQNTTPQAIQGLQSAVSKGFGSKGWINLPYMDKTPTKQGAFERQQQEQMASDVWNLSRWQQGMDYWSDWFNKPSLGKLEGNLVNKMDNPYLPDWLLEKMYQQRKDVVDTESNRANTEIQRAMQARGQATGGLGLGAVAGVASNRMNQLQGARRDVDIWGAQQAMQREESATQNLSNLLNMMLGATQGRYQAETDIPRAPNSYAAFTDMSNPLPRQLPTPVPFYGDPSNVGKPIKQGQVPPPQGQVPPQQQQVQPPNPQVPQDWNDLGYMNWAKTGKTAPQDQSGNYFA